MRTEQIETTQPNNDASYSKTAPTSIPPTATKTTPCVPLPQPCLASKDDTSKILFCHTQKLSGAPKENFKTPTTMSTTPFTSMFSAKRKILGSRIQPQQLARKTAFDGTSKISTPSHFDSKTTHNGGNDATNMADWTTPTAAKFSPKNATTTSTVGTANDAETTPETAADTIDNNIFTPMTPASIAKKIRRVTFAPSPEVRHKAVNTVHAAPQIEDEELIEDVIDNGTSCNTVPRQAEEKLAETLQNDADCEKQLPLTEGMFLEKGVDDTIPNKSFEDSYQAFTNNVRECTDRTTVVRELLIGMELLLTSAHGEMLLVQSDMVDLTEEMEAALKRVDNLNYELETKQPCIYSEVPKNI